MKRTFLAILAASTIIASSAFAAGHGMEPMVLAGDQSVESGIVTAEKVAAGENGWLVVQRNLGSDSLHRWLQGALPSDFAVLRAATHKGYRVLRVRHRTGSADTQAIELP